MTRHLLTLFLANLVFMLGGVLWVPFLAAEKVDVFSKGESGYFCIKIPYLIRTQNNTLIAFAEARKDSCSDYAWTDLVYKRSNDGGLSWSGLEVLRSNSSEKISNVIGNAAPVQCRVTGRIMVPHCRNNKEVWFMYSQDDGVSWSTPTGPYAHLTDPEWKWIGLGPPAGVQLMSNNRIIIPSYHSVAHVEGSISKGHIIYSDDSGDSWHLSAGIFGLGPNASMLHFFPSESQAVELQNGSLLVNSRGESQYRIGSLSNDFGDSFETSFFFADILDQLTGCEGSMIRSERTGYLYYSGLTPLYFSLLRYNMSIFRSTDHGSSWKLLQLVDIWSSSYSALITMETAGKNGTDDVSGGTGVDTIGILYERSRAITPIFVPDHITFETFFLN